MRYLILSILLILSPITAVCQKIPAHLSNPASGSLAYKYDRTYKSFKASYYELGTGLGMTALGYGLIKHSQNLANKNPESMNEGAAMAILMEGILCGSGMLVSSIGVGQNLYTRTKLKRLSEKNSLLNAQGIQDKDIEYEYKKTRLKVRGITTCCFAGCATVGMIGSYYTGNSMFHTIARDAMWLTAINGAFFLVDYAINHSARLKISVHPQLGSLPMSNGAFTGVNLAARF